jgi:hypothetical protein
MLAPQSHGRSVKMRYHKATLISLPEADALINYPTSSLNEYVVIAHLGQLFDVRDMTEQEVEDFIDDLNRARSADVAAGLIAPH